MIDGPGLPGSLNNKAIPAGTGSLRIARKEIGKFGLVIRGKKYAWATRILHGGLATTVIVQLLSSLFMEAPRRGLPGNWFFEIHEYAGLAALLFACLFIAHLIIRHTGTEKGLLFPWLSSRRRAALWLDIREHFQSLRSFRLPPYQDQGALPSAVQGLGLLLIASMASTGGLFYFLASPGVSIGEIAGFSREVHELLANLVWAYLIAHAGMACVHHFTKRQHLGEMWSFRRRGS
jgi:cytochrome b561